MSNRDYKKLGDTEGSNRVQDNTERVLRPIIASAIIDGVLLTDISLVNGSTVVDHKLGRKLQGYIVVKKSADTTIWDGALNTRTITLYTNAACVVSLWCF